MATASFGDVSLARSWRVLNPLRIIFGLIIAPVPGVAIMSILTIGAFGAFGGQPTDAFLVGGVILCALSIWSLICGSIYLLAVTRRRGEISRRQCLFLGLITEASAFALLFLVIGINDLARSNAPLGYSEILSLPFVAVLGGFVVGGTCAPFGLLGGALFWRAAVRPASPTA